MTGSGKPALSGRGGRQPRAVAWEHRLQSERKFSSGDAVVLYLKENEDVKANMNMMMPSGFKRNLCACGFTSFNSYNVNGPDRPEVEAR